MFSHYNTTKLRYRLLFSSILLSGLSLSALPGSTASPPPGTVIENQATGSYVDDADNTTNTVVSDKVLLTVAEVAGITITSLNIPAAAPGSNINFDFLVTNAGNDPTKFFLPNAPSSITGGTAGTLQVVGYVPAGGTQVNITPINITTATDTGSLADPTLEGNTTVGSIPPGAAIVLRIPVTVTAAASSLVTVTLGNTTGQPSASNTPYIQGANGTGTNDLYTYDNADAAVTGEATGSPVNGDSTGHRQEASATASVTVVAPTFTLSGTIFEDVNYGGGAGRPLGTSGTVPRGGATVELYRKSDGTFVATTTTSSVATTLGQYTFSNVTAGDYFVRVVNNSVTSSRPGYIGGLLPVQTFRVDDSTGTPTDDGDRVGGEKPSVPDTGAGAAGAILNTTNFTFTTAAGAATTGGQAASIAPVQVGSSNVIGIDFGFNFDTIVNTNNSGQGSLHQFITNSNALTNAGLDQVANPNPTSGTTAVDPAAGEETSIFMIPDGNIHPGLRAGLISQLTSGVAVIAPLIQLPAITDNFTTIDGRTQTANVGNTNNGQQGTGGTVGVDGLNLSKVNRPEVQIVGSNTINNGITVQGSNTTIRGIAIHGFGNAVPNGNIVINGTASNTTINQNFLGTTASSFSNPGVRSKGSNIVIGGSANNGIIQNNLIGYADLFGVIGLGNNSGWKTQDNEIRDNSFNDPAKDGISFESGSKNNQVIGNLIISQGGNGIDSWNATGTLTIENNTITGNGLGSTVGLGETPGIRLYGTGNRVYRNIIFDNYGAGVMVTSSSTKNLISQNSIYGNGTVPSTNGTIASGQIGIDLLTSSNSATAGTSPYVSANDGTVATGGNLGMDYPIITSSTLSGTTLTLKGFVGNVAAGSTNFANATLEFFISEGTNENKGEVISGDGKSKPHGEGKTYIGTCTADANGLFGTATHPCNLINVPAALTNPNNITATATDVAGNTSEFGAVVSDPNVLLIKRITAINGGTTTRDGDDLAIYHNTVSPYDDNVPESTPFINQPNPNQKDTTFWPTPANFLLGGTNGGNIKPNDEMEYTIYFLSTGDTAANKVELCDRIPANQTFVPTAFNSITAGTGGLGAADRGILVSTANNLRSYTNLADGDMARYYAPGESLPTSCGTGANSNGAIVVNLGTIPNATAPGLPSDSHGFVRFRVKMQ
jgi:hypothetical protein